MSGTSERRLRKSRDHQERMQRQKVRSQEGRLRRIQRHEASRREICPRDDKVVFHTWSAAERARENMRKRGADIKGLHPYLCGCGRFHLGHGRKPDRRKKKR